MSHGSPPAHTRTIDDVLADARRGLERIGARAAADLQAAGALLVDIRPQPWRVANGAIPGALVLERNVLQWRLDPTCEARLDWVDESIYERDVVIVCNEGYASSLAAADLQEIGFRRVTDLDAGFDAWRDAGLPIEPATD